MQLERARNEQLLEIFMWLHDRGIGKRTIAFELYARMRPGRLAPVNKLELISRDAGWRIVEVERELTFPCRIGRSSRDGRLCVRTRCQTFSQITK